jgi:hypothetical protein
MDAGAQGPDIAGINGTTGLVSKTIPGSAEPAQMKESTPLEDDKPVSRQYENGNLLLI